VCRWCTIVIGAEVARVLLTIWMSTGQVLLSFCGVENPEEHHIEIRLAELSMLKILIVIYVIKSSTSGLLNINLPFSNWTQTTDAKQIFLVNSSGEKYAPYHIELTGMPETVVMRKRWYALSCQSPNSHRNLIKSSLVRLPFVSIRRCIRSVFMLNHGLGTMPRWLIGLVER
jgi:hypothetical protein